MMVDDILASNTMRRRVIILRLRGPKTWAPSRETAKCWYWEHPKFVRIFYDSAGWSSRLPLHSTARTSGPANAGVDRFAITKGFPYTQNGHVDLLGSGALAIIKGEMSESKYREKPI